MTSLVDLSDDALRVYTWLSRSALKDNLSIVSFRTAANESRIPECAVESCLQELFLHSFIIYDDQHQRVTQVEETPCSLAFTSSESIEAEQLHKEIKEVRSRLNMVETGADSGLSRQLKGDHATVIVVAEDTVQRALTAIEIFYLGELVGAYGPQRVIHVLRSKRNHPTPLRAVYANMKQGGYERRTQRDYVSEDSVSYFEADKSFKPFG